MSEPSFDLLRETTVGPFYVCLYLKVVQIILLWRKGPFINYVTQYGKGVCRSVTLEEILVYFVGRTFW
jgi:hypothetical protein